jgi:hypothetical protein
MEGEAARMPKARQNSSLPMLPDPFFRDHQDLINIRLDRGPIPLRPQNPARSATELGGVAGLIEKRQPGITGKGSDPLPAVGLYCDPAQYCGYFVQYDQGWFPIMTDKQGKRIEGNLPVPVRESPAPQKKNQPSRNSQGDARCKPPARRGRPPADRFRRMDIAQPGERIGLVHRPLPSKFLK